MGYSATALSLGRQIPAGIIVGLSAVIFSLSYGALLFAGPLAPFVGYGITVALITAVIGALFGVLSKEKAFISGPDSNTISVLASTLAVIGSVGVSGNTALELAIATVFMSSVLSVLVFYGCARAQLSGLIRYIPFPVMAGFLASTGWLMTSGALNIIAQTPLSFAGLQQFLRDPLNPALGLGLLVAASLFALARRVSGALLIPLVVATATLLVNLALASPWCSAEACRPELWMFPRLSALPWLAPWNIAWDSSYLNHFVQNLPGLLVICFVGLLTILLSVTSLELSFKKEFDLNQSLRTHALLSGAAALLGGFTSIISIGRTSLNKQAGGGAVSGVIAAGLCLVALLGGGAMLAYIPKAALGGLVLYLGLNMLKQWLWDQRHNVDLHEYAQIVLILALVAKFGFMVGFSAGLLISCAMFIVSFSRTPIADLATHLAVFSSSVVRSPTEADCLRAHGASTLLYRLSGYVFFGSASKIDDVFLNLVGDQDRQVKGAVIDFSRVNGIDGSAISVFHRILRRYRDTNMQFYFVYSDKNELSVRSIAQTDATSGNLHFFPTLDHAVEAAEDQLIAAWAGEVDEVTLFGFLSNSVERGIFLSFCELREVHQGQLLCAEGDHSDEVLFVHSGSLEVVKAIPGAAPLRLAKVRKGAMVGELAFYSGQVRTGSIVAVEDSSVYILNREVLRRMRAFHPQLAARFDQMVIQKISRDLAKSNNFVAMFR